MKSDQYNITIQYAQPEDWNALCDLWVTCFHDSVSFMNYYYDYFFRKSTVLTLKERNVLKAMIHLNPYKIYIRGKIISSYYMVAVATDAAFRHRGAMTQLMKKAFADCYAGQIPFVYLMPSDEAIYTPLQFTFICRQYVEQKYRMGTEYTRAAITSAKNRVMSEPVSSEKEWETLAALSNRLLAEANDCFTRRDAFYFERLQMENIADNGNLFLLYAEGKQIGYLSAACEEEGLEVREIYCLPEWKDEAANWLMQTFGGQKGQVIPLLSEPFLRKQQCEKAWMRPIIMGRIIDLKEWIALMPVEKADFDITIQVEDHWISENDGIWHWTAENGVSCFEHSEDGQWDVHMEIDALMQWLSGYCSVQLLIQNHQVQYRDSLSEQEVLETLQAIPILHGWVINEIV